MPSNKARLSLVVPQSGSVDKNYQADINDRLRTIAQALDSTTAITPGKTAAATSILTGGLLFLTVPGTLGIKSSATPLIRFPSTVTPVEITALLKQAPIGGSVKARLQHKGADYFTIAIAEGKVFFDSTQTFAEIPKEELITLDILGVGNTFGGADLTVIVRF